MGCHGIGLSRLIGAMASLNADEKGLRWPLNFSPINAMIIFDGNGENITGLPQLCRALGYLRRTENLRIWPSNFWIDDRMKSLSWKLKDADLMGHPITIVLGRKYLEEGKFEIKCRFKPELSTMSDDIVASLTSIFNALDPESVGRDTEKPLWFFKRSPKDVK
jgi:prolyl-tRNA synthetase